MRSSRRGTRRQGSIEPRADRAFTERRTPLASFDLDTLDIATSEHYERNGYPHGEWAYLRKHAPVFWYARDNVDPFWAITKHADIVEISKQPEKFLNQPRLAVFTRELEPPDEGAIRHLLNMDPPDHG